MSASEPYGLPVIVDVMNRHRTYSGGQVVVPAREFWHHALCCAYARLPVWAIDIIEARAREARP